MSTKDANFPVEKNSSLSTLFSTRNLLGFVAIELGILLLLSQFNILSFETFARFIPSQFIIIVLINMIHNRFHNWVGPAISLLVLTFIQLSVLGLVDRGSILRFWPVALIAIGVAIFMQQRNGNESKAFDGTNGRNDFDILAMFSGTEQHITSQDFNGGSATAICGGAEINLSHIQVEDKPAVVNVFVLCGGINFKASSDMLIENRTVAIFGGSSDERNQRKQLSGESPDVVIKGFILCGGMGIEN